MLGLVRTISICLVGICACFVLSSNAGRDEKPQTISPSPFSPNSPTRTRNDTVASKESTLSFDKNNESRTMSGERVVAQIGKELPDTSLALGLKITSPSLHGTTSAVERLGDVEIDKMMKHVTNLLSNKKWRDLIETTEIPWEINDIREKVFYRWLDARESPAHTFRYMEVHLMTTDTQEYDPKLLWWFDYVKMYRRLGGAGTIETTNSDTATSHAFFDDKELFAFLVNKYDLQTKKDKSSVVPLLKLTPSDSRQQVVALFEWLRHESSTEKLAKGMQLFMVSKSNTEQLVFSEWLQRRVSPKSIFDILRIGSHDDVGMFPFWLKYVRKYWNNVILDSDKHFFYYDDFLRFSAEKFSWNSVTMLLKSQLFDRIFDKEPHFGFGSHARNLQALLTRWLWLHEGASPQDFFGHLVRSGKFVLGDLKFLQGILYVNLYRAKEHFTNTELFDVLCKQHSFDEIVELFRWLQEYPGMQEIANDMLEFLTNLSLRRDPRVTHKLQREGHIPQKKQRGNP